jgi:signal transduction histidine kinase
MKLPLPTNTIRLRLTLAYGALFLVSGAALLTLTYFLARQQYTSHFFISQGNAGIQKVFVTKETAGGVVVSGERFGAPTLPTSKVVSAAASAQSGATLHTLLVDSGIALGAMALLSLWLGWVVAGRALGPLRTITTAAREISAQNLHRRLALTGPDDELKQLGNTFDDLLARLERAFEAQRQFAANASHELRTPLTLERTVLEVALADPHADAESLRRACEQVLAAGEQQERLIEALLTLSRSQRGIEIREPVDLAKVAATCLQADGGGLRFETDLRPAVTTGDPRLLERLVSNLVANAVRHNVPGGCVEVRTLTRDGRVTLTVANTGPVVPADQIGRIFEPFQRLDQARSSDANGLGLGLSIVQAVADAHDATVAAHQRSGGGLIVEASFAAADGAAGAAPS